MIKKLLSVFVMLMISAISLLPTSAKVSAEQAAAEQYRQMFRSGNFYVEYQITEKYNPKTKMNRYGLYDAFIIRPQYIFSTGQNGKRVRGSTKAKYPDILFQDGKYYRFLTTLNKSSFSFYTNGKLVTRALVLSESELYAPYLDPTEEWQYARSDLALPDELAIFYWDDPYRDNSVNTSAPTYNGSSKRTINKKEYDCDQYVRHISTLANTNIALEAYNMLYYNGQLVKIQTYFVRDGKEYLIREIDIKAITSEVPEKAFRIKKKIKLYEAHKGDMSDLLEQYTQVGQIGGDK